MTAIRYLKDVGIFLTRNAGDRPGSAGSVQLLLGARLHVDENNEANGWIPATTLPNRAGEVRTGFIETAHLSERQQLKVFYTDVGQGDATLIEAEGAIVIIDGGPNSIFFDELVRRFDRLRDADISVGLPPQQRLHINAMIVSHFDKDHYNGLTRVLKSDQFEVGQIYHNGLPRYHKNADKGLDLGTVTLNPDGTRSISTDLRDIPSARALLRSGQFVTAKGNNNMFAEFLDAAVQAFDNGRLGGLTFLFRQGAAGSPEVLPDTGPDLRFEVLGPVPTTDAEPILLPTFPRPHNVTTTNPHPAPSDSHTVNGNSVVLRLKYGDTTFLFGGDLNQPAQKYLGQRYPSLAQFSADVNKACHHGSPDYDLSYLIAVAPFATVFSSGDNGSYDHPFPDAMGAAAKHSRGIYPLVFSTELVREPQSGSSKPKYGHINARSNGQNIVMAQEKEKESKQSRWHSFPVPYAGPFA